MIFLYEIPKKARFGLSFFALFRRLEKCGKSDIIVQDFLLRRSKDET
jgi:hypothetical protein